MQPSFSSSLQHLNKMHGFMIIRTCVCQAIVLNLPDTHSSTLEHASQDGVFDREGVATESLGKVTVTMKRGMASFLLRV